MSRQGHHVLALADVRVGHEPPIGAERRAPHPLQVALLAQPLLEEVGEPAVAPQGGGLRGWRGGQLQVPA